MSKRLKHIIIFIISLSSLSQLRAQELWLKAETLTATYLSYDSISLWQDQSGNGNHATQTGTKRPFLTVSTNGNNAVFFSNTFLDIPYNSSLNPSNFTLFIIQRVFNGSGFSASFSSRDLNPSRGFMLYAQDGDYEFWSGSGTGPSWNKLLSGITVAESDFELITLKGTNSSNQLTQNIYFSGALNTNTITNSFSANTSQPTRIGAGSNETTDGNYFLDGYIAEIILYSSALNDTEREKIESYLAIKYGMQLSHNYTSSDGTVIYNTGTYGTHVTVIGRDDNYGLHQKISASHHHSPLIAAGFVISNNNNFSFENNAPRPDLTNNQFLAIGHNNENYNTWINDGIYRRIPRKWKVTNTNNIGSVNFVMTTTGMATPVGALKLIIDNDEDLSNGVLHSHNLVYKATNRFGAELQFPAGDSYISIVDNTGPVKQLWLKAGAGLTIPDSNTQCVTEWSNQTASAINFSQGNVASCPIYIEEGMNFNPTISFDGNNDSFFAISQPSLGYGRSSRTSYIVAKDLSTSSGWRFAWSYGDDSNGRAWSIGRQNNQTVVAAYGAGTNLFGTSWANAKIVDGTFNGTNIGLSENGGTPSNLTYNVNTASGAVRIGNQVNGGEYWHGHISEIIQYSGMLEGEDKEKVQTYLALKYGITLQHDYKATDGSTIYTLGSYGNDIAGVGADDGFGLDQKVSSSENTASTDNSDIIIATTNNFTDSNIAAGRTALSNNQFLIWGHNNLASSDWMDQGDYKRVNRMWKVENTASVGAVHFQINLKDFPTAWTNYYLIVDSDEDISSGSTLYQLSNSSGDLYTTNTSITFPAGTSYFTIGFQTPDIDFGDAPNTYSTLNSNDGPFHVIVANTQLGTSISADTDGFQNGTDSGGNASDDTFDDGVTFNPALNISQMNIAKAGVTNTIRINASAAGFVSVWFDLNMDGDFSDSGEKIIDNSAVSVGDTDLTFTFAETNSHGITYARVRYYTTSGEVTTPTGLATSGEVEDYRVYITAERPFDICSNLIVNGGFELPDVSAGSMLTKAQVPGWNSSTGVVDIWETGTVDGITSQEASQLSELNSNGPTSYYQDVITNPGETMTWQIYHRGRTGNEQIEFKLGTPESTSTIQNITTGTTWTQYTGTYTVPSNQYVTRFEISSVSPTSLIGNLLDNIRFYVIDNTMPVITCVSDPTVNPNNAGCTYLVSDTSLDATATDNCVTVTLTHDYDGGGSSLNGKSFPVGATTVNWTATDGSSNTTTCSMIVTVSNNLTVTISADTGNSICSGVQVVFTSVPTNGTNPYSYNFRIGGTSVQDANTTTYTTSTLNNNNVVDVVLTDNNGCTATSSSITMTVHGAITTNSIQMGN